MTVHASREGTSDQIKVQFTYGSGTASISEHFEHLRHFWSQLGQLIDSIEKEKLS